MDELHSPEKVDIEVLLSDPDYKQLLVHYQHGEWQESGKIIETLRQRYPLSQRLLEFQTDIDLQSKMRRTGKDEAKTRLKSVLIVLLWVVAILAVLAVVGNFVVKQMSISYQQEQSTYQQQATVQSAAHLKNLEAQARTALQAGKPEAVLETLVQIEALDPLYPGVEEMRLEAIDLMTLNAFYDQAMQKMQAEDFAGALTLFNQINDRDGRFRDVRFQVAAIERHFELMALVQSAGAAYGEERWEDAITAYEQVFLLEPSINKEEAKEQLLYSYLRSIIQTLDQPEPSIEDLDKSGSYYRKALSLIPQDRRYIQERENLQMLSVELLVTKYYHTARKILRDPNHSERSVDKSVEFLNRALELRPESTQISSELSKAVIYRQAFANFNKMDYAEAIKGFEELARYDSSYPNGMLSVLLYECYTGRGDKYFAGGFFMDAQINYEAAEIIAWEYSDDRIRLFQTQVSIGTTLGKLERYQDAISYIEYALKSVDASVRLKDNEAFTSALAKAKGMLNEGKYYEAYFAYQEALTNLTGLYEDKEVIALGGDNLVYLAHANASTVKAIRERNSIDILVFSREQIIFIPTLPQ